MTNIFSLNILSVFILSSLLILIVSLTFYRLGLKYQGQESKQVSQMIPTSILGLLGLILGFSFSMAISRYEERRKLAVEEANAISTSYLRARLLKEVRGVDIHSLYKEYLEERIRFYEEGLSPESIVKANSIQKEIWKHFEKVTQSDRTAMESLYAFALNNMIDSANTRNFALIKKLPMPIYMIILFIGSVAFGILNFYRGYHREKSQWTVVTFIMLFIVIFTFIYDIDHPNEGLIRISQDALLGTRDVFKL